MSYLTLVWFSREALLSYLWHLQVRLLMKEEEEMEAHPELRMQMEEERRQQDRQQHEESENMLQMIHQKQQQQATDGDLATPHGFSSIPQATESSTPGVTPFRDPNDSATSLILEEEELMRPRDEVFVAATYGTEWMDNLDGVAASIGAASQLHSTPGFVRSSRRFNPMQELDGPAVGNK